MKIIDNNGYWTFTDTPISKTGIFPYLGMEISSKLEPNKIYYVLRPEEELQKAQVLNSLHLLPFVDDHAMLGTNPGMVTPEEKGVHGVIGENIYLKDGVLYANVKVFSECLKEQILNGKKELSMGYSCDYDLTPGTYNGQKYDAVQKNIYGNHLALVQEGRMGHDVRLFDDEVRYEDENTFARKDDLFTAPASEQSNQADDWFNNIEDEEVEVLYESPDDIFKHYIDWLYDCDDYDEEE